MRIDVESPELIELAGNLQCALANVFLVLRRSGTHPSAGELTMAQLSILVTLLDRGPMRMTELAAHERVRTPTVTIAIRRLEKVGRVSRSHDPSDRRAILVSITPKGHDEHGAALEGRCAELSQRLNCLSDDDLRSLKRALGPLERLVENASNDDCPSHERAETASRFDGPESASVQLGMGART
jgi:DNA-binding MarR family transcriptional regulator